MASLRKAINDKCKDCIYDNMAKGSWVQQVCFCTSPNCPLFPVRIRTKEGLARELQAPL